MLEQRSAMALVGESRMVCKQTRIHGVVCSTSGGRICWSAVMYSYSTSAVKSWTIFLKQ